MHCEYACDLSADPHDPIGVELLWKHPDGTVEILLSGQNSISGRARGSMALNGHYELVLHRHYPHGVVPDLYDTFATRDVDHSVPQPLAGYLQFDETFGGDEISDIDVGIHRPVTLDLQRVRVKGHTRIEGVHPQSAVYVNGGKFDWYVEIEAGKVTAEGAEMGSLSATSTNRVSLTDLKISGSLGGGGATNNTVLLVRRCQSHDLSLVGRMVVAEDCKVNTNLRAEARTLSVISSYFGQAEGSRCRATEVLRLLNNDFYGAGRPDDSLLNSLVLTVPASGLFVTDNVFIVPLIFLQPDLKGNETLAIRGNSFWHPLAVEIQRAEEVHLPAGSYQLDGNFWGDPAGPYFGNRLVGGDWLGEAGGVCPSMSTATTWQTTGRQSASGRSDPYAPSYVWAQNVAAGQGVLSPDYVSFGLKERRTLVSFDLRVPMGELGTEGLLLRYWGEDEIRHETRDKTGVATARRTYPEGAPRTVDFIVPPMPDDLVRFALVQELATGGERIVRQGFFNLLDPAATPLRIGVKQMTINAWGYPQAFNPTPRADQDTHTVVVDRLTTALAAQLPLRKRQDIRAEALPSAVYSPLITGFLPQRHNSTYFGLARYLGDELERENLQRANNNRPQLHLLLAVVPQGALSATVGATGFNHPWYPRVAVVEEGDPEAAIHEFGHALGYYAREQYRLPPGWNQADLCNLLSGYNICDIFVDADAGARFWGASLFVADEGLAFGPVPGGIRHCPAGVVSGLRDVMGAIAADVMIPSTHMSFVASLGAILNGVPPTPAPAAAAPVTAAPQAAGTRRILLEAVCVTQDPEGRSLYAQLLPETIACRVAPAGTAAHRANTRMDSRLRAYNGAGSLLGTYDCYRSDSAGESAFGWRQTFDVPDTAARYELETSSHTAEFLWPLPGNWQPQLAVISGLTPGTNIIGPFIDLAFGVADPPDAPRPLGLTLLVSANGGTDWQSAGNYDGQTSARIWRDGLPVSDTLWFKLLASDGFQSQESALGPFRRLESAMSLEIVEPWPGAVAPAGTAWTLAARVASPSEAVTLRWQSSRDGDLGAGTRLAPVALSLGEHRLTCTASDGVGHSVSNSLQVLVIATNQTVVDLQVNEDALRLGVQDWDPARGPVARPQTGRQCEAAVTIRNPGVTNTMRVQLYWQPPGQTEILLAEQVAETAPLQAATLIGTFTPTSQGVHRLRARAGLVAPLNLSEANPANNEWTWAFTNQPPTALGTALRLSAGQSVSVPLAAQDPDGDALTYEIVQPPAQGQLTGTPPTLTYTAATNALGADSFTLRVFDGLAWSAPAEVTVRVRPAAPTIPKIMTVAAQAGQPLNYRLPATGENLGFSYSLLPMLFPELKFDKKTGIVSGIPGGARQNGDVVTVTNAVGLAKGLLTINALANSAPPQITSPTEADGMAGSAFAYQITALNGPAGFVASNLPPGLDFNGYVGTISGSPLNAGNFTGWVGASNTFGLTWQAVALRIQSSGQPPVFTRLLDTDAVLGSQLNQSLAQFCGNNPVQWEITGLPPGLSLSAASGLLTGTPLAAGSYAPTVTARNASGVSSSTFRLTVATPAGVPVVLNPGGLVATVGADFNYRIVASDAPTAYGALHLPAGLQVNALTGVLSGRPVAPGMYSMILTASNAKGQGAIEVSLHVFPNPQGPLVSDAVFSDVKIGGTVDFSPDTLNHPTGFSAINLPKGLTLDPANGRITGRFEETGRHVSSLLATNALGTVEAKLYFLVAPEYDGWIAVAGLDGDAADPLADPDEDGFSNLAEYALGGNPTEPETAPLVQLTRTEPTGITLLFRVWGGGTGNVFSDHEAGGVRYELESAPTVAGPFVKEPNGFDPSFQVTELANGMRLLAIPLQDMDGQSSRFIRLKSSPAASP